MDPVIIGIIGIVGLIIIFLLGLPVGFAMGLIGLIGFSFINSPSAGLSLLPRDFYDTFSNYNFSVIPMFVFMGSVAYFTGMSGRLYDASYILFGKLRGGLAIATVAATAGFSAICGSTTATAASMGKVSIPEMRRYGYDSGLATGCIAAAGALGILIPPSTIFIIYGILTQQSVGKLFISGVIPGIIMASSFMVIVYLLCRFNPRLAPVGAQTSWRQKIMGLTGILEALVLFGLVIGGLFAGFFSPTQAGAAGTAGAIVIGLTRRSLGWKQFWAATKDTLQVTAMIMVIVAGAIVFGHFMAVTGLPSAISSFISTMSIPPIAVMAFIIVMYMIAGCFMDSLAMITLTVPIIFPIVVHLGFDPIWFGVIIVMVTEIGVITPPVGINVYIIKGIATDVPLGTIFKGMLPFLGGMVFTVILVLIFPILATWLPSFISY